jgi:hypothetical protein
LWQNLADKRYADGQPFVLLDHAVSLQDDPNYQLNVLPLIANTENRLWVREFHACAETGQNRLFLKNLKQAD